MNTSHLTKMAVCAAGVVVGVTGLTACGGSTATGEGEQVNAGVKTIDQGRGKVSEERRIAGSEKPGRLIFTQSKGTGFGSIGNHSFGSGEFHVSKPSDLKYVRVVPDCNAFESSVLNLCNRLTVTPTMNGDTLDPNGNIRFTGGWFKDQVDKTVRPGSVEHLAIGKAGDKKGHYLWVTVAFPDANNAIRIHFNVGREAKVD